MAPSLDADAQITELYHSHQRMMVRLATLLLRDPMVAEEVVQDSFVAVHRHWGRLREPDHAVAYLRRTVVNRSRSALRRRGVEQRYVPPVVRDAPGADEDVLVDERRATVLQALQELPTRQREVLVLRYYLDLSEADIASALDISRGAVKSHASRGSARLRELLAEEVERR
ncbi:MAG TPA: SigE family RNA polymerase sigma factor [Microthrixaceae bacterium]|nr:SigE family RNA polymerase sigma factor [Microthrixaceae bacterium]